MIRAMHFVCMALFLPLWYHAGMARTDPLRRRIRLWLLIFIIGLVLSGVTAIPLA